MTNYPNHPEIAKKLLDQQAEINRLQLEREQMQNLLGSIWLYVGWRYVTRQLTTEQKEMWADAVDAWDAWLAHEEGEEPHPVAERWWRDGFVDPLGDVGGRR